MKHHILPCVLVLAAVLSGAVSCKEDKQPSSGGDGQHLVITSGGKSSFKVQYPSAFSVHATNFLRDIQKATGAQLTKETIKKDNETDCEIIIGQSALRKESADILAGISHGFVIKVIGKKVVIAGTDNAWTTLAMEHFSGKLLTDPSCCSDGTFQLSKTFSYVENDDDPQLIARLLSEGRTFDLAAVEVGTCPREGSLTVAQGAASDGEYVYFTMKGNEKSDTHDSEVVVYQYTLSPFQRVGVSATFNGHHANDMTYDTRNKRALVIHGSGGAKLITAIPTAGGLGEPQLIQTSLGIGGITYNPKRNIYGITQGGSKFQTADADFKLIKDYGRSDGMKATYTAQGMGSDDTYVYFPMSPNSSSPEKVNILVTYDWDGHYIGNLRIPLSIESESMFYAAGDYYVNFYNSAAVLYRVYPDLSYKLQIK